MCPMNIHYWRKKWFNIKIKLWSPSQCALQWHWCWWWLCCIGRQRWKLSIQADMFLKKIFSTRICVLLVVKNHIRSPNLLKRKTDIPHSPKIWTRKWFYGAFGKPVYFIKFYILLLELPCSSVRWSVRKFWQHHICIWVADGPKAGPGPGLGGSGGPGSGS